MPKVCSCVMVVNSCSEGIVREYCVKSDGFGGGMQIVSDKIRNFAVGSVPSGVGL